LREVSRRAGVSHNEPYLHFAVKEALLAAIAVAGYEALHAHTTAAATRASDPVEILKVIGQAYIAFGASHPALYRLMFGQGLPSVDGLSPALMEAAGNARGALRTVILAGAQTGAFSVDADDEDAVTVSVVSAWSLVHGFTFLTIDRVVEREVRPGLIADLAARLTERFIAGLTPKV